MPWLDWNSARPFIITVALIFMVSVAVTVTWCGSMSGMPGMDMPGGWTMSMAWMRMPEQTWAGAAATFIGMWAVMMVAMMLPVLLPMLGRYRRAIGQSMGHVHDRRASLTATVAVGYFVIWTLAGIVVYPLGLLFAELAMRVPAISRAVPVTAGVVVMIAGILQLTQWKARQLVRCRRFGGVDATANYRAAWRYGQRLGARCVYCCAGLNAILLITGVMDLRAMALVMMAISAERLTKAGESVARRIGFLVLAMGTSLIWVRI
jgi:predicted metal-binding membrane protein